MKFIFLATKATSRIEPGTIVSLRDTCDGVGLKEGKEVIVLAITDEDAARLSDIKGDGRLKYRIPLDRLPGVNTLRATDQTDLYQPYLDVHPRTGRKRQVNLLFPVSQIIEDSRNVIQSPDS